MVSTSVRPVSAPPIYDQTTQPMRLATPPSQIVATTGFAFQVIPPRANDREREVVALESAMQSLVLDAERPVALEIAGTGTTKRFIIRATSSVALEHAKAHIRARYAQADIRELSSLNDPFVLKRHEAVSVVELRAGAPSYQPMRVVEEETLKRKGSDPILGILASLSVPNDMRAVAQIVLVPAPFSWSRGNLRKAVEHPLESERMRQREELVQSGSGTPSTTGVVMLFVVFIALLLYSRFQSVIPDWVYQAIVDIFLHGRVPQLTAGQQGTVFGYGFVLIVGITTLFITVDQIKRRLFSKPFYDQRMVAQQTSRVAYRVRIRLYVITPGPRHSYWKLLGSLARRMVRLAGKTLREKRRITKIVFRGKLSLLERMSQSTQARQSQSRQTKARYPKKRKRKWEPRRWRECRGLYWRGWKRERRGRSEYRAVRMDRLASLAAAYRQFDTASAGHFVPRRIADWRAILFLRPPKRIGASWFGWFAGVSKSTHYITGDFLSMAWRLPHSTELAELPLVEQKRARTLLIPSCLIASPEAQSIGVSEHMGYALPFALPLSVLGFHTLIGGKSGEGKSTLMVHIAQMVMQTGSLFLLDPHGDLAYEVIRSVPVHRLRDVVFIDLGDKDFSVGLNPLDITLGRDRDLTVASLVATFSHFWESGWGSRMEAPFRAALMTLFEANEAICRRDRKNGPAQQYTLLDVTQVLTDESFCNDLLVDVQDRFIHRFWHEYYEPLDLRQWRERIDPILTKMLQFETRIARRILGQSRSTINLSKLVAEHKIIVVRLATSEAGAQTSPLVGATLLGLLLVSLREQSVLNIQDRVQMGIICDEFQSLPGADWTTLSAELRKYGGAAVLATQSFEYLNKIDPILFPTVLANTKQYFMFRMSADDARTIHNELDVTDTDIVNLDSYMCYVRLSYQNQQQPTFSLRLYLPGLGPAARIMAMRDHCRRLYARRADDVERELVVALGRNISASVHRRAKAEAEEDTAKRKVVKASSVPIGSLPSNIANVLPPVLVGTGHQVSGVMVQRGLIQASSSPLGANGALDASPTQEDPLQTGSSALQRGFQPDLLRGARNSAGGGENSLAASMRRPIILSEKGGKETDPTQVLPTNWEHPGTGVIFRPRVVFEPKSKQRERDKAFVEAWDIAPRAVDRSQGGKETDA